MRSPARLAASEGAVGGGPAPRMVKPFVRALALLGAFTPQTPWLGNRDLSERTGMPASTVTRIAASLVGLGYLHYDRVRFQYRLAAPVFALGYAALANSDVQQAARGPMREFVAQHALHVSMSCRERLDLIVLESHGSPAVPMALDVGVRFGMASSPIGWALLAALPELERSYLLDRLAQKTPRQWPALKRRCSEAIAQVHDLGYCMSLGEWKSGLSIIATPLWFENHAPLVLACVGPSGQMTRARVQRVLAPRLVAVASAAQQNELSA